MTVKAHVVSPVDMVAYLLASAPTGTTVEAIVGSLTAQDPIPVFHKIALRDIAAGETIHRGGWSIGRATQDIPTGGHVHTHNLVSAYSTSKDTQ